jgi:cytoskeletal protein RodZ
LGVDSGFKILGLREAQALYEFSSEGAGRRDGEKEEEGRGEKWGVENRRGEERGQIQEIVRGRGWWVLVILEGWGWPRHFEG